MTYLIAWSIHTNCPYSALSISHLIAYIKTWLCLLFLSILVGLVDAVTLLLIHQPNFPLLPMTLSFLLWLLFYFYSVSFFYTISVLKTNDR